MRRSTLAALLLLGPATACGSGTTAVDATPASTVAHPYDGPMSVLRNPDSRDTSRRAGAAGLALECSGTIYAGGGGDYADSGLESVQRDASAALRNWVAEEDGTYPGPEDGFVVERTDGDRVLLSYDVGEATKVAVIAADGIRDYNDDVGWGVESWAQCDPAELPADVAEQLGHVVWEDADGERVPVTTVTSSQGPEHCDWQDITFLELRDETFLRDTRGALADSLVTTWSDDVALPADATDTGVRHDGRTLWVAADGSAAFLVSTSDAEDVERWPATRRPIGCA